MQLFKSFVNESIGIIDGVFLLFLAIAGNFLAETLGCHTQEALTNKIMAKQIMTFFVIFFTLDYSNNDTYVEHPIYKLIKAGAVYIFFLLFTKMDWNTTLLTITMLVGIYTVHIFKIYYIDLFKLKKDPTKEEIAFEQERESRIDKILSLLTAITGIIIIVGFMMYYKRKRKEYNKTFSIFKFIFGVTKCHRLS